MPDQSPKSQSPGEPMPDEPLFRPSHGCLESQGLAKRQLFELCIEQHADSLYRTAFRLTGHRDLADELIQETYLSAWKSIESLRDNSKMRGWLFAILRNQYTKVLRKLPKSKSLNEDASEFLTDDASEFARTQLETQELVQLAIEKLDADQKLPMLLVAMEGMSVDEAASLLDIPKGTVLSRLHRARQKMKQALTQLGVMNFGGKTK